ncbi:hypothetical protein [Microbacterium sp. zg-YB36]|uniref:hypothetical protein n=1 Tax=Microbacterium sp. zg-YB36 TaxID=2969407 RepID=UPI00214B85BF|nr:hypothetical protein [Microbacterium sp. zg-YB36]MDL5352045.1 hypothetical protein [Microbacterium sp. zg-YB36]
MTLDTIATSPISPELLLREQTRHEVRQRLARGTLARLHGEWELTAEEYASLYAEEQHRIAVATTARAMRTDGAVFSHASAVVVHGLPLFRTRPRRVHVTMRAGAATRSHPLVFRHRDSLAEEDIVLVDGLLVTSLERTIIDAIRSLRLEAALVVADAGLRRVAWNEETQTYDEDAAERFRARLWQRVFRMPGARGIRQARWVLELADGRAESPGETVGRLYLLMLGFAQPRLQVSVPGPSRGSFRLDAGLEDVAYWWEFDGLVKYTDPAMTGGRTPAEVLKRQQWRQDWITATTGWPFTRCGWEHLDSLTAFAAKLKADGVPLPRAHVLPL